MRELRTLFNAYLEQLGGLEGPEVEVLMCQALEAADELDGVIALQKVRAWLAAGGWGWGWGCWARNSTVKVLFLYP